MSRNLIRLSDVRRQPITWLEPGLPCSMLSILGGHPGLGKSMYWAALTARVTRRGQAVVVMTAEDTLEHVLKPRLQAAGADTELVHALVPIDREGNPRGPRF